MISRIPTPNAMVDTSLWPVVKVTLGAAPTEDEYRVALGRLRALRTRGAPHFIIVDARRLQEAPSRYMQIRIATFVFESADLIPHGALGVAVIASTAAAQQAVAELEQACARSCSSAVVADMRAALLLAKAKLGGQGQLPYEGLTDSD